MDNYQAVFDAVRSKFHFSMDDNAIPTAVADQFFAASQAALFAAYNIEAAAVRPSVLYRPSIALDGNKWCALYGDTLAEGVAGFGDSPAEAMADFDAEWIKKVGA